MQYRPLLLWCATALSFALAACGGGGDSTVVPAASTTLPAASTDPTAPALTGDTAADALNRFNWRRQQAGLLAVAHNAAIDKAAQAHSDYQRLADTITHNETSGKPGFTGVTA